MTVRLSTTLIWNGQEFHSGDEIDLPEHAARDYVRAGSAEFITPPIETAALRTNAPKGRNDVRTKTARA